MGEYAVNLPAAASDEAHGGHLPPQLVARWAALAAERSALALLPQQTHTV